MPEPVSLTILGGMAVKAFVGAVAAHKSFHHVHPHICGMLHGLPRAAGAAYKHHTRESEGRKRRK